MAKKISKAKPADPKAEKALNKKIDDLVADGMDQEDAIREARK